MADKLASKVPLIRFKGFAGDWEEKELGELADIKLGKMLDKVKHTSGQLLPYLNNLSLRWNDVDTSNLPQMYFKDDELERFGLQAGDVVVCEGGEPGRSAIWDGHLPNLKFQKAIHRVRFNVPYEAPLLVLHLKNIAGTNRFEMLFTGGGIKHLTREAFSLLKVPQPSLQEQREVAHFFSELDSLIGLHQRKHDKLVTLKKAMLQKMFPQPGTTTPEIRFKGFSGEWVEKKVDDICNETYGGGTPRTSERKFWEGEIPWIQSSDITDGEIYRVAPRKYISDLALRKSPTKLVPGNSIAIVTRVGVGKLALIEFSYAASQDFLSLSRLKLDQSFAVVALSILLQSKLHETQGTSIKGITKEELLAYSFTIPNTIQEQQKIGTYFRTLDELISQHATQLQKLQQLKSACLEKMFV